MKPSLTIHFMNGSISEIHGFACGADAIRYAREKISYSEKVCKVTLTDGYGHQETLWQHDWNELSKSACLADRA